MRRLQREKDAGRIRFAARRQSREIDLSADYAINFHDEPFFLSSHTNRAFITLTNIAFELLISLSLSFSLVSI